MIDWLPTAKREPKGRHFDWSERSDPKGCLHTTETSGWPGYRDWTTHPHATIMPTRGKGIEIRQNVPFSRAGFSLRNESGGVQTNSDYVFQFELIGTCERGGPGYFWPEADDVVLLALYDQVIYPLSKSAGIPLRAQPFQSYPSSYGARGRTNTVRMSGSAFDNWSGWLGHQHVPENSHGDPGNFPWARMMRLASERNEELDMTEKELKEILAAERKVTLAGVRAQIVDVLKNEPLVANKPTAAGLKANPKAETTFWPIPAALSNVEGDDDNFRDRSAVITSEDRATMKAIQESQTRILELLGKLTDPAQPV